MNDEQIDQYQSLIEAVARAIEAYSDVTPRGQRVGFGAKYDELDESMNELKGYYDEAMLMAERT